MATDARTEFDRPESGLARKFSLAAVSANEMAALFTDCSGSRIRAEHRPALSTRDFVEAVGHPCRMDKVGVVSPELSLSLLVADGAHGHEVCEFVSHEVAVEQGKGATVMNGEVIGRAAPLALITVSFPCRALLLRPVWAAIVPMAAAPLGVVLSGHERPHEFDTAQSAAEVAGSQFAPVFVGRLAALEA